MASRLPIFRTRAASTRSPRSSGRAASRKSFSRAQALENLRWSPDGKHLSYADNSRTIWILNVASGEQTKVDADPMYGPAKVLHYAWAPDSNWLAYTKNSSSYLNTIRLYSLRDRESFPISDGLADASFPVFDPNGKYLYFLVSPTRGRCRTGFAGPSDCREPFHLPHGLAKGSLAAGEEATEAQRGLRQRQEGCRQGRQVRHAESGEDTGSATARRKGRRMPSRPSS